MHFVGIEHGIWLCDTSNNITEYWELVHSLRQANTNDYSLLNVIGNSPLVLLQLRTWHLPRKLHLVRFCTQASAIVNDFNVSSWGHHYCTYNKIVDRLANIAMDT